MAFFCIHCKSEIDPKFKACPYCGEAITDFLRRHLETPIDGKYQILSRLGIGGMGEVYKVLHVHLNTIRVIKLMRANIATDPGAHERFLREARLATKIHHPNVATLFDFSTLDDGSFYMVWEHIEGINLHELINQRGPLSPSYAARLASQALMGLDAVHRAGIVHRDVSPENIMIAHDEEGVEHVKIIDLGIAKSSAAEDNNTKTGMFVGKWKYCSPEHLGMLTPGERIDGRADIYSFGIVLYEMLTGVPPFQADTPHAYLMLHSQTRPRTIRETNPKAAASPELETLVFRALEKDRTRRFATAREFAQALDAIAPLLSDVAGAPAPLPPKAEVTDEATRYTDGEADANDAVTVTSTAQDAPTIAGRLMTPPPAEIPLRPAPGIPPIPAERPNRATGAITVAAGVVIAIAVGGWMMMRNPTAAPQITPSVQASTVSLPAQDNASQPGRLGINAFPWANVTSIRNLDNGENVDISATLVTPAPVDLAPGRYEITLSNPRYKTITRTVDIDAGEEETLNVTFRDPSSAALPNFGVKR
ncbi:MAG TPA: protein kinase [Thermoanaerobaculia bacterium]|nr:protein kinase [Thermoanaerobaculia bacterium]